MSLYSLIWQPSPAALLLGPNLNSTVKRNTWIRNKLVSLRFESITLKKRILATNDNNNEFYTPPTKKNGREKFITRCPKEGWELKWCRITTGITPSSWQGRRAISETSITWLFLLFELGKEIDDTRPLTHTHTRVMITETHTHTRQRSDHCLTEVVEIPTWVASEYGVDDFLSTRSEPNFGWTPDVLGLSARLPLLVCCWGTMALLSLLVVALLLLFLSLIRMMKFNFFLFQTSTNEWVNDFKNTLRHCDTENTRTLSCVRVMASIVEVYRGSVSAGCTHAHTHTRSFLDEETCSSSSSSCVESELGVLLLVQWLSPVKILSPFPVMCVR